MRGVENPDVELVADVRPRHFADEFDVEPFVGAKATVHRHDGCGGVAQRNETYAQTFKHFLRSSLRAHFNRSDAMTIDCAISAIFLFSFMAVLRIRA